MMTEEYHCFDFLLRGGLIFIFYYISKIIYGKMNLSIESPWEIVLARYIKGNEFKFSKICYKDYKIKILLILINLIEHPFMKITKEKNINNFRSLREKIRDIIFIYLFI
jgi:hypothetical protein